MTGFDVAPGALADATAAAGTAAERLRVDSRRIDAEVQGLLGGGWRGSAADSFRECWGAWLMGASRVIEGLDAMGALLTASELVYEQNDCRSGQQLSAVAGRIVERLG